MAEFKTLKEWVDMYTDIQILRAASRAYLIYHQDLFSLHHLIERIRQSEKKECENKTLTLLTSFLKTEEKKVMTVTYAGITKNGRNYRLTHQNAKDIESLASCPVRTCSEDSDNIHYLVITLLSLNAFSKDVIDCYFCGDSKEADAAQYLIQLNENREKAPRLLRESFDRNRENAPKLPWE